MRWVNDELVEVRFVDAHGSVWRLVDKAAVFGNEWLTPEVELPVEVLEDCEVVGTDGQLVTVTISRPWSGPAGESRAEFQVTPYQLRGGVVAREVGFFQSAEEIRAAITGGEQPWEQDALRYLKGGCCLVVSASLAEDLLDPGGRGVPERGEWTDGVWIWCGTLVHYLREYHVSLPAEFLDHMAANGWTAPRLSDDEVEAFGRQRYSFWDEPGVVEA